MSTEAEIRGVMNRIYAEKIGDAVDVAMRWQQERGDWFFLPGTRNRAVEAASRQYSVNGVVEAISEEVRAGRTISAEDDPCDADTYWR